MIERRFWTKEKARRVYDKLRDKFPCSMSSDGRGVIVRYKL